jgi:hypothetical protein
MLRSIIDQVPQEIAGDVALINGALYYCDTRQGDEHLIGFISSAKRQGITEHHSVPAEDFMRKYGGSNPSALDDLSDIQSYAVKLLTAAYEKKRLIFI